MPRTESLAEAQPETGQDAKNSDPTDQPAKAAPTQPAEQARNGGAGLVLGASWFILGCVAGAAALVLAFWDRISAMIG